MKLELQKDKIILDKHNVTKENIILIYKFLQNDIEYVYYFCKTINASGQSIDYVKSYSPENIYNYIKDKSFSKVEFYVKNVY